MKYLEQRVEELEKELALVRAKIKLEETKTTGFVNEQPIRLQKKDRYHYLTNNYPPPPDWRNKEINDYMFNSSVNLMSEPDLETAFASPWDSSEMIKCPLNSITVSLSSTSVDNLLPNLNYVDFSDPPYYHPEYPYILGSWDDEKSFNDVINEDVIDKPIYTSWGFESKFDKMDKDFLKNSLENKIEKEYGKIISKFKVLDHKWEMDGYCYIVSGEKGNQIVTTNHGKPMVVDKDYLHTKIREYKETIQETERALFLVK